MSTPRQRSRRVKKSDSYFAYQVLEARQMLATATAVQDGPWDAPATWDSGVPDATTRAIIPAGIEVTLSGADHVTEELVVQGVLDVEESADITRTLTADWVHVNSGGLFSVGSESNPYDTGEFVLTLTGDEPDTTFNVEGVPMPIVDNNGFLMAAGGGSLQFFGDAKIGFTKLAATVEAGSNQILVEKQLDRDFDGDMDADDGSVNWEVGDEIVIASSKQDYSQEEVRTITAMADQGNGEILITLDSDLEFRHYGEIESYSNPSRTYDIDLRAEVALLSRNVRIEGEGIHDTDNEFGDRARFDAGTGDGFGGHIMIMPNAGQIIVDGVQLDGLGQTSRLGRYPIHWHLAGDRTGDVLKRTSITNSNNRGVTVHGTHNLLIQDVVLHDIHGHGFFMEDGVETGNQFISNIAFGIHKVGRTGNAIDVDDPFIVDTHDHVGQNPMRFLSSAGFWITNPDNTWIGNISAGSEGTGFWFILPEFALGESAGDAQYDGVNANRTNLRQFDHNTTHSSPIGLNVDRGKDVEVPVGSNLESPFLGRRYLPPDEPQYNFFTAYQHQVGTYHRGNDANFHENRYADNFTGTFITFTQRITDTLYVGHSRGNANSGSAVTGHSLYDGANTLTNTHFAGYGFDNAHNFRVHGAALRHTHYVFNNTTFENDGSANRVSISNQTGGSDHDEPFGGTPSALYDADGTFTGHVGGGTGSTIVADHPFFVDADDFKPAGWNAWVTDDIYALFRLEPADSDVEFLLTAPDGDTADVVGRFNTGVKIDHDYWVEFPQGPDSVTDGFEILYQSKVGPSGSNMIRFIDAGDKIVPDDLPEAASLADLRNETENAYALDGNDMWVKLFSSGDRIVVEGLNNPPVAVDDDVETDNGTPVRVQVLDNDSDPDGDPLSVVVVGTEVGNVLDDFQRIDPPDNWQYLWNESGEFGVESTYAELVWDSWRYKPASVNFPYVSATSAHPGEGYNQDPDGIERFAIGAFTVPDDGVYSISDSLLTLNPQSFDGITMKVHVSGGPVIDFGEMVNGKRSIDVTLGSLTAGQVIYVGVGGGKTAGGDSTAWDFSIVKADQPANGEIRYNSDETFTFIPVDGFEGLETFNYRVSDGRGGWDSALVSIDVLPGNAPPVAVDDDAVTDEDVSVTIDVLDNDSDPEGDTLVLGPVVADFVDDFERPDEPKGWQYLWNETGAFGDESTYEALIWDAWRYKPADVNFPYVTATGVHPGDGTSESSDGLQRYSIAAFTVPADGFYSIVDSSYSLNENSVNGVNIAAHVSGEAVVSLAEFEGGESGDFNTSFGFLTVGQVIYIGVGANENKGADGANWDYSIQRDDNPANGQLVYNADQTITYIPNQNFHGTDSFTYIVGDGNGNFDTATVNVNVNSVVDGSVDGTFVYYADSTFGESNARDGIAPDKNVLLPGQASGYEHYSNYHLGINGLILDVAGFVGTPSLADFEFQVGNDEMPENWPALDVQPTFDFSPGSGEGGADQVTLTWPDNTIENQWLRVTIKDNASTDIGSDYVFLFGNQIGDVFGETPAGEHVSVNAFDTLQVRLNQSGGQPVGADNRYDIDRNGFVNAFDSLRVRLNQMTTDGLLMFGDGGSGSAFTFDGGEDDSSGISSSGFGEGLGSGGVPSRGSWNDTGGEEESSNSDFVFDSATSNPVTPVENGSGSESNNSRNDFGSREQAAASVSVVESGGTGDVFVSTVDSINGKDVVVPMAEESNEFGDSGDDQLGGAANGMGGFEDFVEEATAPTMVTSHSGKAQIEVVSSFGFKEPTRFLIANSGQSANELKFNWQSSDPNVDRKRQQALLQRDNAFALSLTIEREFKDEEELDVDIDSKLESNSGRVPLIEFDKRKFVEGLDE